MTKVLTFTVAVFALIHVFSIEDASAQAFTPCFITMTESSTMQGTSPNRTPVQVQVASGTIWNYGYAPMPMSARLAMIIIKNHVANGNQLRLNVQGEQLVIDFGELVITVENGDPVRVEYDEVDVTYSFDEYGRPIRAVADPVADNINYIYQYDYSCRR